MPSIDEISLLRLLNQCQLMVTDTEQLHRKLPKLKAFTLELRKSLKALEADCTEDGVHLSSHQSLEEYKAEIYKLEMTVAHEEKAIAEALQAANPTSATQSPLRSDEKSPSSLRRRNEGPKLRAAMSSRQREAFNSQRDELFGGAPKAGGAEAVGGNNQEAGSLDGDTTAQLTEQRRLQEDLTDDLLRMTTEMKQRTLLMSSTLVEDDKVMNAIDAGLNTNRSRITSMTATLEKEVAAMWKGTLGYCGVFVFVTFAFVMMYMFMRIFPKQF